MPIAEDGPKKKKAKKDRDEPYVCGHVVCKMCADTIIKPSKACPLCEAVVESEGLIPLGKEGESQFSGWIGGRADLESRNRICGCGWCRSQEGRCGLQSIAYPVLSCRRYFRLSMHCIVDLKKKLRLISIYDFRLLISTITVCSSNISVKEGQAYLSMLPAPPG